MKLPRLVAIFYIVYIIYTIVNGRAMMGGTPQKRPGQIVEQAGGAGQNAPSVKAGNGQPPSSGKSRLVRDSFTFPESEYAQIAMLKQRVMKTGREAKKSELLRAGLAVLATLPEEDLIKALGSIAKLKPGRPSK